MKRLLSLIVVCVLCSVSVLYATGERTKGNDPDGADTSVEVKNAIAFVGIESRILPPRDTENGFRDYFKMDDAEVEIRLNQIMFEAFSKTIAKSKFRLVACSQEQTEAIVANIDYIYDDVRSYEKTSDLSACADNDFLEVLAKTEAQYLLVIDQYDVRKEGYPYDNFAHVIKYSLYDREKNKIFRGRHQFAMLDAVDANTLTRQSQKAASKLLAKF